MEMAKSDALSSLSRNPGIRTILCPGAATAGAGEPSQRKRQSYFISDSVDDLVAESKLYAVGAILKINLLETIRPMRGVLR